MTDVSITKNAVYNMLKTASSILFSLVTIPYISRTLLDVGVGKVSFGASIISYFSLLANLGISTYAIRECAKVRDNKEKLGEVASQLLSLNFITTIISYTVLFFLLSVCRSLDEYRSVILIQSTAILFLTFGADWLNTAMEDFRFIAIRTFAFQIISLILLLVFVHTPEDYLKYAAITALSSSAANILNIFYRRKFCLTRFMLKIDFKRHLPPIFWMFSLLVSQIIFTNSDQTMLGIYRGDSEVGLYSTSVKIYTMVNFTIASIAFVVMPQMSYNFENKNYFEINKLFAKAFSFIFVLGFPCIIGLFAVADDVICVVAGSAFTGAILSLKILCISLCFSYLEGLFANVINIPAGREKISLIAASIAAIVNVGLNFIVIPTYGLNGAAFTTAVAELIALCINYFNRDKQVIIGIDVIKKIVLAPFWGVTAMIVIILFIRLFIDYVFIRIVTEIVLSVIVYLSVLILMKHEFTLGIIKPFMRKFFSKL